MTTSETRRFVLLLVPVLCSAIGCRTRTLDEERKGFLGLEFYDSIPEGWRTSAPGGIVRYVAPGLPAFRAGIRPGDIVTEVEGRVVTDSGAAAERIHDLARPGRCMTLRLRRGDVLVSIACVRPLRWSLSVEEAALNRADSAAPVVSIRFPPERVYAAANATLKEIVERMGLDRQAEVCVEDPQHRPVAGIGDGCCGAAGSTDWSRFPASQSYEVTIHPSEFVHPEGKIVYRDGRYLIRQVEPWMTRSETLPPTNRCPQR